MANAGKALAEAAHSHGHIVVLCGKGNNGGDGFAAAGLLLRWGHDVSVVLMEPARNIRGPARSYLDLLPAEIVVSWPKDRRRWHAAAVLVDCMLGSGIRDAPRAPYDQAIRWMNKHAARVVACDVPSGFGTMVAVRPNETVTFHARKDGMTEATCGVIRVADIGIPKDAGRIGFGDLDAGFVRPHKDAHKGEQGRVLVVGGGPFTGAPHYAGMGAVRSGADLVHVATTDAAAAVIQSWGPDLLVHAVGPRWSKDAAARVVELARRADALVLGPGLGPGHDELVHAVLDGTALPAVIDAEALQAMDAATLARHGHRLVLTPHGREFAELSGKRTEAAVAAFAKKHSVSVLRKGAVDVVSDGQATRRCHRGHATMTVGGTGDVLAGAVGALLARGAPPFDAACAGAYLVGCAGEVAASVRGLGATATDVHEAIPAVLLRLE